MFSWGLEKEHWSEMDERKKSWFDKLLQHGVGNHSFSTYAKVSEKLTFLTP